jgi:cleavage and polyadenylation specificity factor subunit 1
LKEYKDTVKLIIFTLDFVTQNYPIIRTVEGLPHDCLFLLPCATSLGGVVIVTCNSIIYVDQSSKRVPLPINGWPSRISDLPMPTITPENHSRNLELEGCRAAFVDDKTIFIIHRDGTVYPVDMVIDGKTVAKLTLKPGLAQTTIPTVVKRITDGHIFVGSTVGPSVLLKAVHVEEEIEDHEMDVTPTAVVQVHNDVDMDDEDAGRRVRMINQQQLIFVDTDIYGPSKVAEPSTNGLVSGKPSRRTRAIIRLLLCDSLPGYGPIADMTFSLARNGVRLPSPVEILIINFFSGRIARCPNLSPQLVQALLADSHCSRLVPRTFVSFLLIVF